jgi:dTDP-glucose pyrophosphorylase
MSKPTLIVLAAGIGSRYGGLKQVDPIGPHGEIIVDYSIYDALRAGFGKVVFVINKTIESVFRERVGANVEKQCETVYVLQEINNVPAGFQVPPARKKPWGTGHATLICKDVIDSPFAVINADDFYGRSAYEHLAQRLGKAQDRAEGYDYCMVGYRIENTLSEHGHVARGVCAVDEDGFLDGIRERTHIQRFGQTINYTEDGETWIEIPQGSIVSLNTWGFTLSLFAELETRFPQFLQASGDNIEKAEFFLPNVVGDLIQENKATVKVLPTDEKWFGVTYQQDKPKVKEAIKDLIQRHIYPENLWGDSK